MNGDDLNNIISEFNSKKDFFEEESKLILHDMKCFMNPHKMVEPLFSDEFSNCYNHIHYPTFTDNLFIFQGQDGLIYCINIEEWKLFWFLNLNDFMNVEKKVWCGGEISGLDIVDDKLLFFTQNSLLLCIDKNSGEIIWRKRIDKDSLYYPNLKVDGNYIIITMKENYYIYSVSTGELEAKVKVESDDFFINSELIIRFFKDEILFYSPIENRIITNITEKYKTIGEKGNVVKILENNGIVYIVFGTKSYWIPNCVVAYNIDGERLWIQRFRLVGHEYEKLEKLFEINKHGFSCYDSFGNFYIIDLLTGKEKFIVNVGKIDMGRNDYFNDLLSPIFFKDMIIVGKENHVGINTQNVYYIFELESGKLLKEIEGTSNPVIYKDNILLFQKRSLNEYSSINFLLKIFPKDGLIKKYKKDFSGNYSIKKLFYIGEHLIFYYTSLVNMLKKDASIDDIVKSIDDDSGMKTIQVFEKIK